MVWRHLSQGLIAAALAGAAAPALAQEPAQAPPPGVGAEIRASVGGKLKDFYRKRGYWPLWVKDNRLTPAAEALLDIVEHADLDGLDPDRYRPKALRRLIDAARGGSPAALAEADLKLSGTLIDYVRDVRRPPAVKMTYLDREVEPVRPTETAILRAVERAGSVDTYVRTEGWMSPIYVQLREGLADYRENWADLPAVAIPGGGKLAPGTRNARVGALRQRLGLPAGTLYDKAVTAKVRAFQIAHGLGSDGVAGPATIAALNRNPGYYERLVQLNLERARILPGPWDRHIVVDVASQRLWVYEGGAVKDTMRVIVGKPTEQTPMLAGMMRYATVNPYWNVPPDLVSRRVASKMLKGATLRGLGFEALSDWTNNARVLADSEVDWRAVADGRINLRVRQLPGGTNAMGKMKFMFPNDLGIYLHDTPEKALFKKDVRQFSSGCVRVEDAPRLARWLFGKPLTAPSKAPEQNVYLPQGVPVYLTYLTAAPDKSGIAFRADSYGRDAGQGATVAAR